METNILQGNDNAHGQGSWVRRDQGVDPKFSAVSKHWIKQCITFDDVQSAIAAETKQRHDIIFDARNVKFHQVSDDITVEIDGQVFTPTPHAARQLCNWFHTPQTVYTQYTGEDTDSGDIGVIVYALNNGKRKYEEEKNLRFRTYDDGTLRAVLSEEYAPVPNAWYVGIVNKYIPGALYSHWRGDGDTLFGNVLIPDSLRVDQPGYDSDYGGMLSLSNCEIGRRVLAQTPSILRAICMNGCIWGQVKGKEFRRRHRWEQDLNEWEKFIKQNIMAQIPLATKGIDMLLDTRMVKVEQKLSRLFAAIAKESNLGGQGLKLLSDTYMGETHREKTWFDVVDSVTRVGQKLPAEQWVQLDMMAGEMVSQPKIRDSWEAKAKALTDEQYDKMAKLAAI